MSDDLPSVTPDVQWSTESQIHADPVASYRSDGEWKQGVRPANVIETIEDVDWALRHSDAKQTRLVCRFCGDDRAVRTTDEGQRWFRTHACEGEGVDIEQWLAA
jgi:hypothetical protein